MEGGSISHPYDQHNTGKQEFEGFGGDRLTV